MFLQIKSSAATTLAMTRALSSLHIAAIDECWVTSGHSWHSGLSARCQKL